jgi:hypothetical protein
MECKYKNEVEQHLSDIAFLLLVALLRPKKREQLLTQSSLQLRCWSNPAHQGTAASFVLLRQRFETKN